MTITQTTTYLAAELRESLRGEVRDDPVARALYATDASIYQVEPLGVAMPLDERDVAEALRLARKHGAAIVPRGGATSLAGQTVGRAIHLDFTRYMRHLLELNVQERWAWVEPGMVLDELNAMLAPHNLMFAPDVSPGNRATIGGMIGNNSCGMYSLRFGKTIDHVLELKVMLSDGTVTTLGPLDERALAQKLRLEGLEGRAYRAVRRLAREQADEIERRFPKLLRRVGGYNLDEFTPRERLGVEGYSATQHSEDSEPLTLNRSTWNLSRIVVGSEGTLAIVLAAKLRLTERPAHTAIGVVAFETLDGALDAVMPCLECRPAAVELMDDILLRLTRQSREYSRYLAQFVRGEPGALLQVEFFGETPGAVASDLERLEAHLRGRGMQFDFTPVITPDHKKAVLQVRKAGLPLLQSLSPNLKPETFVEDSAVAPERLADYIRQFRTICRAEGVEVAFYGHASVGLMHARPLLNLKDAEDVGKMRRIAEEIRDLVLEYGGALSGEHGDGMLRAEFNQAMFGAALYQAFREVKRTFDPRGVLNPGKIVDAPPMDTNLRYGAGYQASVPLETHFRFADAGGMVGAAELCNGNGLCRKTASGTMCPSYMVTREEEHSTRGRANALRMVFSGALGPEELTGERMKQVMDLCIECKGCTGECPSRVNMTRLKSEWLSMYHARHGVPLRTWVFGHIRQINELGARLAPLANRALGLPGAGLLAEKLLGVSRRRRLPEFAREPFHSWFERQGSGVGGRGSGIRGQDGLIPDPRPLNPTVVLFPDTFADYNEPHVARAAVRLLEAAGYRVILPERRVCCGRPLISKGLLGEARALARRQVEALWPYAEAGLPIVGLEPSCILTFRDEYPDLLDDPRAATVARQSFLIDEFLAKALDDGEATLRFHTTAERAESAENCSAISASSARSAVQTREFLLHGHCHQKALVGSGHALALLRRIPGATVREVDSGCCGMAGSFGYEAEHYPISKKIAERALLPAVRALPPGAEVVAMGTSCRHQIADLAGRRARHLVEVLAEAVEIAAD